MSEQVQSSTDVPRVTALRGMIAHYCDGQHEPSARLRAVWLVRVGRVQCVLCSDCLSTLTVECVHALRRGGRTESE